MSKIINKGFCASILENKEIGNCSNKGMSYWHDQVTIVSDIEECQIFDIDAPSQLVRPIVVIKKRTMHDGSVYVYAEPIDEGHYMMGGSFIYSSDSRFRKYFNEYPIPLHDRQEN